MTRRGLTLLELLTASTLSLIVILALSHLDVSRVQLGSRVRTEATSTPQAEWAMTYLLKTLERADQVNFPEGVTTLDHVQVRLPPADPTKLDDPASYRWREYTLDAGANTLRFYTAPCPDLSPQPSPRCSSYDKIPSISGLTCQQSANLMAVTVTALSDLSTTRTYTGHVAMRASGAGQMSGLSGICPSPQPCFGSSSTWCGDGTCNGSETSTTCPTDCTAPSCSADGTACSLASTCCGGYCNSGLCASEPPPPVCNNDGWCDFDVGDDGETCSNCPLDCGPCSSSSSSSGGCFLAGTRIATERGLMPIEQLNVGMRVWSRAETGELQLAPVTDTFQRQVEGHLRLHLMDGRVIHVTTEHPFWDATRGAYRKIGTFHMGEQVWQQPFADEAFAQPHRLWRALLDFFAPLMRQTQPLQPVTMLVSHQTHEEASDGSSAGGPIPIHAIVPVPGPTQVFNITVGGNHNYVAEGVLVHNKISSSSSSGVID